MNGKEVVSKLWAAGIPNASEALLKQDGWFDVVIEDTYYGTTIRRMIGKAGFCIKGQIKTEGNRTKLKIKPIVDELPYGSEVVLIKKMGPFDNTPLGTIGTVDSWDGTPTVRFGSGNIANVHNPDVQPTKEHPFQSSSIFEYVTPLEKVIREWLEAQNAVKIEPMS